MPNRLIASPEVGEIEEMPETDRLDSYIVCATSRSGSTLLCRLLSASGVAGRPDSYFHRPSVSAWAEAMNLPPRGGVDESDYLRAVVDAVKLEGTGGTSVFGLRLMRKSFDFLMSRLELLYPDISGDTARIEAAFGRTAYIHLTRDDKVAQAVSLVKANQTGLWHLAPDGTELERSATPRPLVYDANRISRHVDELTADDEDWRRWFEREQVEPDRVRYEDLSRDPAGSLTSVLDGLGLDRRAAEGVLPGVARLSDEISRRWVKRFRAERGGPTAQV